MTTTPSWPADPVKGWEPPCEPDCEPEALAQVSADEWQCARCGLRRPTEEP